MTDDPYRKLCDLRPPTRAWIIEFGTRPVSPHFDITDPFSVAYGSDLMVEDVRLYRAGDPEATKRVEAVLKDSPKKWTVEEYFAHVARVATDTGYTNRQTMRRIWLQENYPNWTKENYPWL